MFHFHIEMLMRGIWGRKVVSCRMPCAFTPLPSQCRKENRGLLPVPRPVKFKAKRKYERSGYNIMSTASEEPNTDEMNPQEVAKVVLEEIKKLQKEISPPLQDTNLYLDSSAFNAFQAVDQAIAGLCAVPQEQMLEGFQSMIEGERLDGLLDALVSSSGHPALENACLLVMCGVVCLPQAHCVITKRKDVQKALFGAVADRRPLRINPGYEEEGICVCPAVGAAICLNR